ncbi:MAG: hypothetical protein ABIJ08_02770 [Nanoarchaeota archaeon]
MMGKYTQQVKSITYGFQIRQMKIEEINMLVDGLIKEASQFSGSGLETTIGKTKATLSINLTDNTPELKRVYELTPYATARFKIDRYLKDKPDMEKYAEGIEERILDRKNGSISIWENSISRTIKDVTILDQTEIREAVTDAILLYEMTDQNPTIKNLLERMYNMSRKEFINGGYDAKEQCIRDGPTYKTSNTILWKEMKEKAGVALGYGRLKREWDVHRDSIITTAAVMTAIAGCIAYNILR